MPAPARLLAAALAGLTLAPGLGARDYYVAPWGDDAASGSLERPFRTLAHAVHAPGPGDTLYLRAGTYRETLYAVRAGRAGAPVVFSAYGSEKAVLSGAEPVSGAWRRWKGRIWRAAGQCPTTDVFWDGRELRQARWPAAAPGAPMGADWARAGEGSGPRTLFDPSLPDLPSAGARARIVPGLGWVAVTVGVRPLGRGALGFAQPLGAAPAYRPCAGNRYILYGSRALLDGPGQWWQDPRSGGLYVWGPDGSDPRGHAVETARRPLAVYDAGRSHVVFRGFETFCGGVKISRASDCRVEALRQRYVQHYAEISGYWAPPPTNGFYRDRDCAWVDGSIRGSSGDGLLVSGDRLRVRGMAIADVDRAGGYGAALDLAGRDPDIEDNTLADSGRYLINLGTARGGVVRGNELSGAGLLTRDVGAIYAYRSDGGGMVLQGNYVHAVRAVRGVGIYLDNGCSDYVVARNVVTDCAWSALELNLPSNGNRIVGNTLWGCPRWVWADGAPHTMTGTVLVDNLVSGRSLLVTRALAPRLAHNAAGMQPPPLFGPGGWAPARASWALGRGVAVAPWDEAPRGRKAPDLGAVPRGGLLTVGCAAARARRPGPGARSDMAQGPRAPAAAE